MAEVFIVYFRGWRGKSNPFQVPKSLAQALLLRGVLAKGVSGTSTFTGRPELLQRDKSTSFTWIKIRPDQTLSALAQNFCLETAECAHSPQPGGNKLAALISSHQACFAGKSAPTCALTCRLTDLWQIWFFKILSHFNVCSNSALLTLRADESCLHERQTKGVCWR